MKLENKYDSWVKEQKRFLSELREIIPEAEFIKKEVKFSQKNSTDFYDYRDSKTNSYLQELNDLKRKEEEKDNEIKFLRKDLKRLRDKILKREEELEEIDAEWSTYDFELNSVEKVKVSLKGTKEELENKRSSAAKMNNKINKYSGNIDTIGDFIDELYKEIKNRYNKTPCSLEEVNLDEKGFEIESSLEENRSYCKKLYEMIEDYKDKNSQLDTLIFKLESYNLNSQKGEMNNIIKDQIRENPEDVINKWIGEYQEIKNKLNDLREKTERDFNEFK